MPKVVDIQERRAELATAVYAVAARDGVEAITIRRVAAEAGWSTGTLVHYFADKEALLLFAFELVAGRAEERMSRHAGLEGVALARALVAEALPLDAERRDEVAVWFGLLGLSVTRPELAAAQAAGYERWRAAVASALGQAGRGGADEAAALIAVADGLAVQAYCDPEGWPAERLERLLDSQPVLR